MKIYKDLFNIVSASTTLFDAWEEFKVGKGYKDDVLLFEKDLEPHLFSLARDLKSGSYRHGGYIGFYIYDPKLRHIHKATVRDRILHHALFGVLNPVFEPTFIANSFSCQRGKGNHKGVEVLETMLRKVSRNNTKPCYVLKCDIAKFFDSIDHKVLLAILNKRLCDAPLVSLLENVVESYASIRSDLFCARGVPIGNLTSQLFANVYMNEFDQFMKRNLKVEYYGRYTDDFFVVSGDKEYLKGLLPSIETFLSMHLGLELHPKKVEIRAYEKGVDFLGYVLFPHYRLVRARTKRRMKWKLRERMKAYKRGDLSQETLEASFGSYLGVLSHASSYMFSQKLKNDYWLSLHG